MSGLRATGNRLAELTAPDGSGLLGDVRALLDQLGSPEGGIEAPPPALPANFAALKQFLHTYKREVLIKHEWPAIYSAYNHASHNECHELIALDESIARERGAAPFAEASRCIGQFQLKRLAPLRGERVLTRYMAAVDEGRAQGWHTLVYGLTLALYSLPARQGLMHYAQQILRGYLDSAAHSFSISDDDSRSALGELLADLPGELEKILKPLK
ncbi:MAG TPA: urease accessory UreF family protein [Verrucomicrobiae bacterium]|nr:urease accessory UreF family protein [Verrucomicrobiae bacterium]